MSFSGTLLAFQPEAVDRMVERGSLLLSYDLGLGKTVITIAAIERMMDSEAITKPGLVICLSSLKYQWADAIHQFTGGVRDEDGNWSGQTSQALVIDGTPKQRAVQYEASRKWEADYTILSYEQVVRDWELVRRLPRGFLVCDEATAIKHFRSQRSRRVKELTAPYRYALTGTPIENGKPEELYSIMQWVDPEVLGRFDLFDRTFIERDNWGGVKRYRNLKTLNKRVLTAAVRKGQDDADVSPFLPAVRTMAPLLVPFDKAGAKVYDHIVRDLLVDLADAQQAFGNFSLEANYGFTDDHFPGVEELALRGSIMSKLTCLRMLCDHPDLLRISAARHDGAEFGTSAGSKYASELQAAGLLRNLKQAPKFDATLRYIQDFLDLDEANKIVLFSYFKPTLDLLHEALSNPYCRCSLYTGDLSAKEKESEKRLFQTLPHCRILLSSDAGGYGVDLPQANMLINYDLPWAPGVAKQRNGRIRRASSTWSHVVIQDILMRGSLEERMWKALRQKDSVASAVIDGEGIDSSGQLTMSIASFSSFFAANKVA